MATRQDFVTHVNAQFAMQDTIVMALDYKLPEGSVILDFIALPEILQLRPFWNLPQMLWVVYVQQVTIAHPDLTRPAKFPAELERTTTVPALFHSKTASPAQVNLRVPQERVAAITHHSCVPWATIVPKELDSPMNSPVLQALTLTVLTLHQFLNA